MTGKTKAGLTAGSLAVAGVVALMFTGDSAPTVLRANVQSVTAYRVVNGERTSVDETFKAPRYAFVRIPNPGTAVRWEVLRGGSSSPNISHGIVTSRTFWRANYMASDGSVTLPVSVDGPIENQRVQVFAIDAAGVATLLQPPVKLTELPAWSVVQ